MRVPFLDVAGVIDWIGQVGTDRIIAELADKIESAFLRWDTFSKSARVAEHSRFGVIELMPVSDERTYGFKFVNGHPANPKKNLQTVTAFGVLADVATGYPTFVAEMTILTALRTAATSVVAARTLANTEATSLAFIGAGAQAEFQAIGLRTAFGSSRVRVFDVDQKASAKFCRNLEPLGFEIEVASTASEAAAGAQIVTTCTADKRRAVVLPDDAVAPGMHLNALGGDCPGKTELDPTTLDRAAVFVEFEPQTRLEGEIQTKPAEFAVTELWRVLTKNAPGRSAPSQITVFDSVGFAIEDLVALQFTQEHTAGSDLTSGLDLIASPTDPKDLFALANRSQSRSDVSSVLTANLKESLGHLLQ